MSTKDPLRLSVKAKNWRMFDSDSEAADTEFALVRKKVLERDDYSCKMCGFKASKWQEVHHVNDDHSDNRKENLLTVCMYCHLCQHIGLAGRNQEAVLAWIPEIPQDRLHHIIRSVQVAKRWSENAMMARGVKSDAIRQAQELADGASSLMAKLRERQMQAEERIGTSDPLEIANIMLSMPDDMYERRGEFLAGIRLLPLGIRKQGVEDMMPKIVDSWLDAGGAYVNLRPSAWLGMFRSSIKNVK